MEENFVIANKFGHSLAFRCIEVPLYPLTVTHHVWWQIIQANSTHKTQLMELSLMREEEKQNYKRQEENMVSCAFLFGLIQVLHQRIKWFFFQIAFEVYRKSSV